MTLEKSRRCHKTIFAMGLSLLLLFRAGAQQSLPCGCCCTGENSIACYSDKYETYKIPKEVIFDFKTKLMAFPKGSQCLRRGDAIRIKVVNFNPFLYQVSINGSDSNYSAVIDNNNLLSAFTSLSNISSIVGGLASVSGSSPGGGSTGGAVNTTYMLTTGGKTTDTSKPETKAYMFQPALENLFKRHIVMIGTFSSRFRILRSTINNTLYEWDRRFRSQRYLYPTCQEFEQLASSGQEISDEFKKVQDTVNTLYTDIGNSQRDYLNALAAYSDAIRKPNLNQGDNRFRDSLIRTYYNNAANNINICDSLLSYKILTVVEETIDRMKDVQPCYTSTPIILQGDSKLVTLTFSPWSDSLKLPVYPATSFELPWAQQIIWGVSGGIYGASLSGTNYAVQPNYSSTDTTYTILKDKGGSGEFGIDALAYVAWHLHPDQFEYYNYLGVAFGAALSIEASPKPRVLLGVSFETGRTNRLLLTMGGLAGYTQTISSAYQPGTVYSFQPAGYTTNTIKEGFFLSVNYSFIN
jgi:hypothetical protein